MWIEIPPTLNLRVLKAWVTWRPPQEHLHYPELYAGVWEFLREAPVSGREAEAREYLYCLQNNTVHPYNSQRARLQRDRIEWVRAWLGALGRASSQHIG